MAVSVPRKRFFYGWVVVFACVSVLTLVSGVGLYCFSGVFSRIFADNFHWDRSILGGTVSFLWVAVGISGFAVGKLVNRFGAKRVMLGGSLLCGAALFSLSRTTSWPYMYAHYFFLGVANASSGIIPMGMLISRWFVRRRGLAMGILATGIAFGGLVLVPVAETLVNFLGWRYAYIALGTIVWSISIPMIILVIKERPEKMGLAPDGDIPGATVTGEHRASVKRAEEPWSMGAAFHTVAFWLASVSIFLAYFGIMGILAHQRLYHLGLGFSVSTTAIAYSITAGMGVAGKLGFGYLADRLRIRYCMALCCGVQAIGVLLLATTRSSGMLWTYVIIWGAAMGGIAALQPLLILDTFGSVSFPVVYGAASIVFSAGQALGPLVAGWIYDISGSYYIAFMCFLTAYLLAVFCVLCVRQPHLATIKSGTKSATSTPAVMKNRVRM